MATEQVHTEARPRHPLELLSLAAWAVIVVAAAINLFFVPTFREVGHLDTGCYITDALWFYVRCTGFPLAPVPGFFLSLPFAVMLGPYLIINPLVGVPLWALLLLPAVRSLKRRVPHLPWLGAVLCTVLVALPTWWAAWTLLPRVVPALRELVHGAV